MALAVILAAPSLTLTDNTQRLYLSHRVAFHSVTLLAAGIYLLALALAGYFIRYLGGSWGGVLQITFLCAAGLLLIVLLFSGHRLLSMMSSAPLRTQWHG